MATKLMHGSRQQPPLATSEARQERLRELERERQQLYSRQKDKHRQRERLQPGHFQNNGKPVSAALSFTDAAGAPLDRKHSTAEEGRFAKTNDGRANGSYDSKTSFGENTTEYGGSEHSRLESSPAVAVYTTNPTVAGNASASQAGTRFWRGADKSSRPSSFLSRARSGSPSRDTNAVHRFFPTSRSSSESPAPDRSSRGLRGRAGKLSKVGSKQASGRVSSANGRSNERHSSAAGDGRETAEQDGRSKRSSLFPGHKETQHVFSSGFMGGGEIRLQRPSFEGGGDPSAIFSSPASPSGHTSSSFSQYYTRWKEGGTDSKSLLVMLEEEKAKSIQMENAYFAAQRELDMIRNRQEREMKALELSTACEARALRQAVYDKTEEAAHLNRRLEAALKNYDHTENLWDERMETAKKEVARLQAEAADGERHRKEAEERISTLQAEIASLHDSLQVRGADIVEERTENTRLSARIVYLEEQLSSREADIQKRHEVLETKAAEIEKIRPFVALAKDRGADLETLRKKERQLRHYIEELANKEKKAALERDDALARLKALEQDVDDMRSTLSRSSEFARVREDKLKHELDESRREVEVLEDRLQNAGDMLQEERQAMAKREGALFDRLQAAEERERKAAGELEALRSVEADLSRELAETKARADQLLRDLEDVRHRETLARGEINAARAREQALARDIEDGESHRRDLDKQLRAAQTAKSRLEKEVRRHQDSESRLGAETNDLSSRLEATTERVTQVIAEKKQLVQDFQSSLRDLEWYRSELAEANSKVASAEEEQATLQGRIATLNMNISAAESQNRRLAESLEATRANVRTLEGESAAASSALEEEKKKHAAVRAAHKDYSMRLQERLAELAGNLREAESDLAAVRRTEAKLNEALPRTEDVNDEYLRRLEMAQIELRSERDERVAERTKKKEELLLIREKFAGARSQMEEELEALRTELRDTSAMLSDQAANFASVRSELTAALQTRESELRELESQRAQLSALLAQRDQEISLLVQKLQNSTERAHRRERDAVMYKTSRTFPSLSVGVAGGPPADAPMQNYSPPVSPSKAPAAAAALKEPIVTPSVLGAKDPGFAPSPLTEDVLERISSARAQGAAKVTKRQGSAHLRRATDGGDHPKTL